ncbi:prespore protein [Heterostelium album PN500]|uniref:Prespore protein n=1 Tax=Heterostelium pallidum (strain ATCC 26659 / Pp 5 / PN500) TaxID=670386 RepID=D3BPN2_HETP5|nr:prespore protein [Heterostelium album PN500]EFA76652.1 prespore protein [Heterostelium album PN500]|eukprot:XP_020428784.1 prespore protein [Heterostelium album PN500]
MKIQGLFLVALMIGSIYAQIDANCANYVLTSAQLDQFGPAVGGSAITFADPNVPGGFTTYNFVGNNGNLANNGNQITITGVISPADGSSVPTWDVKMVFNKQASGTPKKELKPNAYAPQGPVDPNTWQYYAIDPAQSSFVGHGGSVDGVTMNLTPFDGMLLQVGVGANGKNVNNGLSGWFSCSFSRNGQVFYTSTQVVDINVDMSCRATQPPTQPPTTPPTQPPTTGTPSPTVVTGKISTTTTPSSTTSTTPPLTSSTSSFTTSQTTSIPTTTTTTTTPITISQTTSIPTTTQFTTSQTVAESTTPTTSFSTAASISTITHNTTKLITTTGTLITLFSILYSLINLTTNTNK